MTLIRCCRLMVLIEPAALLNYKDTVQISDPRRCTRASLFSIKLKQGLPHFMDISYANVNYHVHVSTKLLSSVCV